ncbi:FxDxF family PEP-CTERM protein [Rugamonas fusca]|nr:FxDxF family PEP-CTERM protein [Rugamonas fusca]
MKMNAKSVVAAVLFASAGFIAQGASAATATFDADGFADFHSDAFAAGTTTFHQTVTFTGLAAGQYNIEASISGTRLFFSPNNATGGVWLDGHSFVLSEGTQTGKLKSGNLVYTGGAPLTMDVWGKIDGSYKQAYFNGSVSVTAVPEPETYGMLLGGLALMGVVARRKAKKSA